MPCFFIRRLICVSIVFSIPRRAGAAHFADRGAPLPFAVRPQESFVPVQIGTHFLADRPPRPHAAQRQQRTHVAQTALTQGPPGGRIARRAQPKGPPQLLVHVKAVELHQRVSKMSARQA
jgi:hypothetical protein